MVRTKRTAPAQHGDRATGRHVVVQPLTLTERIRQRLQAKRLKQLLDELDQQHGPIPAEVIERARRAWPED